MKLFWSKWYKIYISSFVLLGTVMLLTENPWLDITILAVMSGIAVYCGANEERDYPELGIKEAGR
jgi:hypothetical protein